jgi:hypothetical protein
MTAPMDEPNTSIPAPAPVTAASPSPDPAIAPGTPDPDEAAAAPADVPDRWLRFDGPVAHTVDQVGHWAAGEVKHVAGWLAQRLLQHPLFAEVPAGPETEASDLPPSDEPAADATAAPETVAPADAKPSRRRVADVKAADTI